MSKDTWPVSASSYRINWRHKLLLKKFCRMSRQFWPLRLVRSLFTKTGVTSGLVDSQTPVFIAMATREIIQKVSEFEPRAIIHSVSFDKANASDGVIRPKLVIGVKR